mgnify:CR=1 FL=1
MRFEVATASGLPGQGYDLITFFDSLHDIGDPLGALTRARAALAPSGAVLLVEPLGADWRRGQPQPGRAHVLRRFHPGVHAERGVPEDVHVVRSRSAWLASSACGTRRPPSHSAASAGSTSRPAINLVLNCDPDQP